MSNHALWIWNTFKIKPKGLCRIRKTCWASCCRVETNTTRRL